MITYSYFPSSLRDGAGLPAHRVVSGGRAVARGRASGISPHAVVINRVALGVGDRAARHPAIRAVAGAGLCQCAVGSNAGTIATTASGAGRARSRSSKQGSVG